MTTLTVGVFGGMSGPPGKCAEKKASSSSGGRFQGRSKISTMLGGYQVLFQDSRWEWDEKWQSAVSEMQNEK
jgi:hypothetical protein